MRPLIILRPAPGAVRTADKAMAMGLAAPVGLALAFRCARQGLAVTVLEAGYPVSSGHRAEVPAVELLNNHHVGAETAVMRALGGTANLWGGRCVRFDDIDFAPRGHVAHSGWPIAHAELAPHYPEALRFLGCEPTESPAETSDKTVDDGNTEWWSGSSDIAALHAEAIRDLPNLKIHTGCVARRLIIDPASQRVTAIEVERAGRIVRVAAGAFALAAGGLENTRLLLHTRRDRPDLSLGSVCERLFTRWNHVRVGQRSPKIRPKSERKP